MNSNGLPLLSKCADHNLQITNTIFRLGDKYKVSWMHWRSKQWHLIDYVITRKRDCSDVLITRAMRGAECWTDNRLISVKLNVRIVPQNHKRPTLIRETFNTAKLLSAKYKQEFQSNLDDKFKTIRPLTGGVDQRESRIRSKKPPETAKTVRGPKKKLHQE